MNQLPSDEAMRATADVIIAYLDKRPVEPEHLPELIRNVRAALAGDEFDSVRTIPANAERHVDTLDVDTPSVAVEDSVTDEYLISLEDGQKYRSLKRHLRSKYDMSPEDYRRKWSLPEDYPMVAPALAKTRSEMALKAGFGRARPQALEPPPAKAQRARKRSAGVPS